MEKREYTTQDQSQFDVAEARLGENGFDRWTQQGLQRNADLFDEYFQTNQNIPVTVETIFKAVSARKQDFRWLSPAQVEYYKIAPENPRAATKLAEFFATQGGRPGTLINTGDEGFENSAILLTELRGRDVNPTTIQHAIGRIIHNGRRQLHFVPTPRRVNPQQHQTDPEQKTGQLFSTEGMVRTADGGWRNKTVAEQAAERRAADAKNNPVQKTGPVDAWQTIAENTLGSGRSHGQNQALKEIFTKGETGELSWRQVATAMSQISKGDRSVR
jgi:hypothetical protein